MILDKDLPEEESKLGIAGNPVDVDEASQFTLEAELVRLSKLIRQKSQSRAEEVAMNNQIRTLMKQAKEDNARLSKRGKAAFEHLEAAKATWDRE